MAASRARALAALASREISCAKSGREHWEKGLVIGCSCGEMFEALRRGLQVAFLVRAPQSPGGGGKTPPPGGGGGGERGQVMDEGGGGEKCRGGGRLVALLGKA